MTKKKQMKETSITDCILTQRLQKKVVLLFKGATKLYTKVIFVPATKIGETQRTFQNCCFSQ